MSDRTSADQAKRLAGEAVVTEITDGMLVGIGTGSTAAFAIAALGRRIAEEGLTIRAVCTSLASEAMARDAGIPVLPFDDIAHVDFAFDGADEIDGQLRAIKGLGGALLREKIIATAARRAVCIVDASKTVDRLGATPVPIEVLPFARAAVAEALAALGGNPILRAHGGKTVLTDQSNIILDTGFGPIADPHGLARDLQSIPGLLGHGLFLTEFDALIVGTDGGVTRSKR